MLRVVGFDVLGFDTVVLAFTVCAFVVLRVTVCVCAEAVQNGFVNPRSKAKQKIVVCFMRFFNFTVKPCYCNTLPFESYQVPSLGLPFESKSPTKYSPVSFTR